MAVTMKLARVRQPRGDRRDMTRPEPAVDVFEHPGCGRKAGAELRERVALEGGDAAGKREGDPDGGAGDLARRTEQREDAGADHGADADERGLTRADARAARGGCGAEAVTLAPGVILRYSRLRDPFGEDRLTIDLGSDLLVEQALVVSPAITSLRVSATRPGRPSVAGFARPPRTVSRSAACPGCSHPRPCRQGLRRRRPSTRGVNIG